MWFTLRLGQLHDFGDAVNVIFQERQRPGQEVQRFVFDQLAAGVVVTTTTAIGSVSVFPAKHAGSCTHKGYG